MARKPTRRIPTMTRRMESARRTVRALVADVKRSVKRTPKPGRSRATTGSKTNTKAATRPNPWRKCPECRHRVPETCSDCGNGRANVVRTHPEACCPGPCRRGCGQCASFCTCRDKEQGE
jgi:hypothetical protein